MAEDGGEHDGAAGKRVGTRHLTESEPHPERGEGDIERGKKCRLGGGDQARAEAEQHEAERALGDADRQEREVTSGDGEGIAEPESDEGGDPGGEAECRQERDVALPAQDDGHQRHRKRHQQGNELPEGAAAIARPGERHDDANDRDCAGGEHAPRCALSQDEPGDAGGDEGHGGVDHIDIGDRRQHERADEGDHAEPAIERQDETHRAEASTGPDHLAPRLHRDHESESAAAEEAAPEQDGPDVLLDQAGEESGRRRGDRRQGDEDPTEIPLIVAAGHAGLPLLPVIVLPNVLSASGSSRLCAVLKFGAEDHCFSHP